MRGGGDAADVTGAGRAAGGSGTAGEAAGLASIAVVGAGAMGTLFAGKIAQTGRRVVLIDVDRERLARIDAAGGVGIVDDAGAHLVPVETATAGEVDARIDLVIVFTKSAHTRAAAASVRHLARQGALALTLQNGLGNPEAIAETFGPQRVLKGVAFLPADHGADGAVHTTGALPLALGPLDPGPEGAASARAVAAMLADSGFAARASDEIDVEIWRKLAFNTALNTLGAALGMTNGELDAVPGHRLATAIAGEVIATARALGIAVSLDEVLREIDDALKYHAEHESSMLQDVRASRATEIDALAGAVCECAAEVGVPTPVTRTLAELVRLVELRAT